MQSRRRVRVAALVALLAAALLVGQAVTAAPPSTTPPGEGEAAQPYPGNTLISVQAYGWFDKFNGSAFIVNPEGEKVWEYKPPDAAVFDAEELENGNILVSFGQNVPAAECPAEYRGEGRFGDHCVKNRVVEVDRESGEVVWEYSWYDAFIHWHEVHDADRLPNGETAIIDMGNDRAFTVNEDKEVTWQWNATEHIANGTDFWEEYVPADEEDEFRSNGPEDDWTHMNDIDRLDNGHFTLSIRNFDVVLEVDPETNEIVNVVGAPGDHSVMDQQHNPDQLERHGTMLIADSENDRIVEVDVETDEIVWTYDGPSAGDRLRWPRDADRLPNGNTLVTDSRKFRVLEVSPNGTVVWQYTMPERRGIAYEADRLGVPEEPENVPSGRELEGKSYGPVGDAVATAESWMAFFLPHWFGVPELLTTLLGVGALAVVGWETRRT
jgi:outer membrane protein assembly factor BamB